MSNQSLGFLLVGTSLPGQPIRQHFSLGFGFTPLSKVGHIGSAKQKEPLKLGFVAGLFLAREVLKRCMARVLVPAHTLYTADLHRPNPIVWPAARNLPLPLEH